MNNGITREMFVSSVHIHGPEEIFSDLEFWCKSANFSLTRGELIHEFDQAPCGQFVYYVKEIPKTYEDGDVGDIIRLVFIIRMAGVSRVAYFIRKDLMDTVESLFLPLDQ